MLLPLGTDRPLQRPTLITYLLVAAVVGVFLVLEAGIRVGWAPALRTHSLLVLSAARFEWWALITYAFLHAGWLHLIGNVLFLWVFGPNVEDRFGRVGFLAFFLTSAAVSGAAQVLFAGGSVVGASGAIAGVTGAYMVLFPKTHVRVFVLFIFIGVTNIPALWFVGASIAWDVIHGGAGTTDRVARLAHLGGYGFGVGLSLALLFMGLLPRDGYDLVAMLRQAYRRRQLADAVRERESLAATPVLSARSNGTDDRVVSLRAAIMESLRAGREADALRQYRALTECRDAGPAALLLQRAPMLQIANSAFQSGDHPLAAEAYDRFARGFPRDMETGRVRLMLALVLARYLNRPAEARAALEGLDELLTLDHQRSLAKDLRVETTNASAPGASGGAS
ncbi:MAG: rhomboid family intramembrane serine protease [Phycisphaerae bacterium]|nr:rhomboid family intramembrane serine protease [Phycisphaerae bacterium]